MVSKVTKYIPCILNGRTLLSIIKMAGHSQQRDLSLWLAQLIDMELLKDGNKLSSEDTAELLSSLFLLPPTLCGKTLQAEIHFHWKILVLENITNFCFLFVHDEQATHLAVFDPTCRGLQLLSSNREKGNKKAEHMTLMCWTAHILLCLFTQLSSLIIPKSVGSFGSTNVFLGSTTKDHFSQPCDQCLGSSQHPSRSWNTSDPTVISQASVPISHLALLFPKGHFHPGHSTGLGTGIPAPLIFCLLVTIQDVPAQSRKDSGGQLVGVIQAYLLCAGWSGITAILCLSASVQNPHVSTTLKILSYLYTFSLTYFFCFGLAQSSNNPFNCFT